MEEFSLDLHRAAVAVRTEPFRFVFFAHEGSAAVGTDPGEFRDFRSRFAPERLDSGYFRYDFPAFLDIDVVSFVDVEGPYLVFVDQRCTLDHGAGEKDRLKVRHGSDCPGAADLIVYRKNGSESLLCLELVGDCPAWGFGSIAEFPLEGHLVDLDDYTVGRIREFLAVDIPIIDEILDFRDVPANTAMVRHRKPPGSRSREGLVVGFEIQALCRNVIERTPKSALGYFIGVDKLQ